MPQAIKERSVQHWRTSVVIIGSGVAGLACALALAPIPVLLLTKTSGAQGGSSLYAQGGIAAALGEGDSAESHAADTVAAGAGLVDAERALLLALEGADIVRRLVEAGVPFDRAADGTVALGREAAHSFGRIVHAGGDTTGRNLINALLQMAMATPSIRIVSEAFVVDLVREDTAATADDAGRISGLLAYTASDGWVQVFANHVVLASGGIGSLWRETTNPIEATGDGLALAARAGATLADLEFVQFHPTALLPKGHGDGARLPLLTEALRGAGAQLLDREGRRFMPEEHPLAELAPRDVVARAIARRTSAGEPVLLDLRPALAAKGEASFPQALTLCRRGGFEPLQTPVPVAPAAHYHMGGVVTDAHGRTAIAGLWACGEVAMTGVHGANRLASNSLLEGLVFGHRVAADIRAAWASPMPVAEPRGPAPVTRAVPARDVEALRARLRVVMATHVGIERSGAGLELACEELARLQERLNAVQDAMPQAAAIDYESLRRIGELRNMLTVARLVTVAALRRTESRGAHFRGDWPDARPEWERRLPMTLADLDGGALAAEPALHPLATAAE